MFSVFAVSQAAWRFTVQNFGPIVQVCALPAALVAACDYFLQNRMAAAIGRAMQSGAKNDALLIQVYADIWLGFVAALVFEFLMIALCSVAIMRMALGLGQPRMVSLGRPEIITFGLSLAGGLLILAAVVLPSTLIAPFVGRGPVALLVYSLATIMAVCAAIYVLCRLGVAPVLATLGAQAPLRASWVLLNGRIWRMAGATLLTMLPWLLALFLMNALVTALAGGPELARALSAIDASTIAGALETQMRTTLAAGAPLAVVQGVEFVLLTAASAALLANVYRALTSSGPVSA